jgi:hypothetical protein
MTNPTQAEQQKMHKIHGLLVADTWSKWKDNKPAPEELDAIKYTRLSVVSLTHVAAVLAVDVGMNEEQYLKVCKANFTEAVAKAPKWG